MKNVKRIIKRIWLQRIGVKVVGSRINSKQKGARGERMWASFCREHGFKEARRTAQFCGNTGQAADVVGLPHIHVECKYVEKLNVRDAMSQAVRDSEAEGKGNIPIVAHKKNYCEWLVTMRAEDWFSLYINSDYSDTDELREVEE